MNSDTLIKCVHGMRAKEVFEARKQMQEVLSRLGCDAEGALIKSGIAYCLGVRAGIRKERQRKKESIK